MKTRQEILDELKRTTKENNGKPLGMDRFQNETGIAPYEWQTFWPRFSDAQIEAGFEPNTKTLSFSNDVIFGNLAKLIRKLKKFPTQIEMRLERTTNPEFPSLAVYKRLGSQQRIAELLVSYYESKDGYDDVIQYARTLFSGADINLGRNIKSEKIGYVYLFKSGRDYKIGNSADVNRRGLETDAQLAEPLKEIHRIKTDDPYGIEAYWHKRFAEKRKRGEWFKLNSDDVKAFKRWRKIA
jgi:hypothetical protein